MSEQGRIVELEAQVARLTLTPDSIETMLGIDPNDPMEKFAAEVVRLRRDVSALAAAACVCGGIDACLTCQMANDSLGRRLEDAAAVEHRDRLESANESARFWSKVASIEGDGCWEWAANLTTSGYGQIRLRGNLRLAHRVAYVSLVGQVPQGLELDHLCRNRKCVRPDHLEPVSHAENMRRGEVLAQALRRARGITHCPRGHLKAGENLYVSPSGKRGCKECRRMAAAKNRAARNRGRS